MKSKQGEMVAMRWIDSNKKNLWYCPANLNNRMSENVQNIR